MKQLHMTCLAALLVSALATVLQAQEPTPKEPFKTVHLVNLTSADVATLQAALADLNAAMAKAGHPEIRYRVFRVVGKQMGSYNYLWESSWPSGAVYDQVHKDPAYMAATTKHPEVERLMKNEIYNRYVEVTSGKP